MLKAESFPIEKIYVPVKRRKALNSDVVQEIAQSILEIGQQAPILIRPDEDRFVLIEGFIGWKRAKRSAKKQSDCWSGLRLHIRRDIYAKAQRQKQNARRWSD